MSSFDIPAPGLKLALDGKNYGYWSVRMRVYFQAVGVWDHITGASPCPPAPAPPPPGAASQDAANKSYQEALDAYNGWCTDDARAKFVLFDGVEACIADKPTAQQMWADLKERYQPIVDATHYSLLRRMQKLKQGSDSVEAFFDRFMSVRSGLDCLIPSPEVCRNCACCVKRREFDNKSLLYDFLIRLRPEFHRTKSMLLCRSPVPTVIDALNALRVEEIRLQIESDKPWAAAPAVDVQCDFCGDCGHTYDTCIKRKKKSNRRGGRHEKGSSEPSKGSSSKITHYEPLVGLPFRYQ